MPYLSSKRFNINEETAFKNDMAVLNCLSEDPKSVSELLICSKTKNGPKSKKGIMKVRDRLLNKKLIEYFYDKNKIKYKLTKKGVLTYEKLNWPVVDELLNIDRENYYYFQDESTVFSTSTIYDTSAPNSSAFNYLPTFSEIPLFIKKIFGVILLSNTYNIEFGGREGEVLLLTKINIKKFEECLFDFKLLINAEDNLDFLSDNRFKISQISDVREKRERIQFMIDLLAYGSNNLGEDIQNKSLNVITGTIKNNVNLHKDLFSDLDMVILKDVSDDIEVSVDPLDDKTIPHKKLIYRSEKNNLIEYPLLNYVMASKLWKLDQNYNEKANDYLEKYPNGLRWRLQRGEIKP